MLVVLMSVHIIGAAIAIYIHCRDGTMEQASKYGDGIRWAKPFVWVEEQHTLGFLYSKITVEDRFLHKFIFCVPSIWAFRYKLSIKFYYKEDSFNEF